MKAQPVTSFPSSNLAISSDASPEGGLDLGRTLSVFKRRAGLITAVTAIITAAAGIRAHFSPPIYSANFEVLIQPQSAETEVLSSLSNPPLNQKDSTLTLNDQVRILTSPDVLQPVVATMMKQGQGGCSPASQASTLGVSADDLEKLCYRSLRSRLDIQLTKDSRIFQASYRGTDSDTVEAIANQVAKTFLDYGLASRQRDIQQGLDFLDKKLPDVRQRVDTLQAQLQHLRQSYGLIDPDSRGTQLTDQISTYEDQYLTVLMDLEENLTLYQDLKKQLAQQPQDASVSPVLSDNSRYQALVKDLLALDSQIAEASTLYLANSPDMQALQEQRQNLLALLAREGANAQRELLSQIKVLSTRESSLSNTLGMLDVDVDELADLSRQFSDLDRELAIATDNLSQLLQRRETLQIEAAQRELPWELITPPTVSTQIANLSNSLVLGLLLGFLLGTGLALTLDAQKDVLYTPRDLKRITPVPILGLIPHNPAVARGQAQSYLSILFQVDGSASVASPLSPNGAAPASDLYAYKEAFRSLVANLRRVDAEQPIRSLVISAADNERTDSTTAAYLAWAAAEIGNRVLLIDADFRQPQLHHHLGLENAQGFGNLLAGEQDLKQAIRRSPAEPNLFVLTTGTTGLDPVRLLSADRIQKFGAKIESFFELVIYSAPPFSDCADAALLAAETSGLVLVSNLGTVKSTQLERTLEQLWISKIPLIGIIAKTAAPRLALLSG